MVTGNLRLHSHLKILQRSKPPIFRSSTLLFFKLPNNASNMLIMCPFLYVQQISSSAVKNLVQKEFRIASQSTWEKLKSLCGWYSTSDFKEASEWYKNANNKTTEQDICKIWQNLPFPAHSLLLAVLGMADSESCGVVQFYKFTIVKRTRPAKPRRLFKF